MNGRRRALGRKYCSAMRRVRIGSGVEQREDLCGLFLHQRLIPP